MTSFDTDGDGRTDQEAFDTDGDGRVDVWYIDKDENGVADDVATDTDHDGAADTWTLDGDGDGMADQVATDVDRNGLPDTWAVDVDRDGIGDATGRDVNGDGVADTTTWDATAPATDAGAPVVVVDPNSTGIDVADGLQVVVGPDWQPGDGTITVGPPTAGPLAALDGILDGNPDFPVGLAEELSADIQGAGQTAIWLQDDQQDQ